MDGYYDLYWITRLIPYQFKVIADYWGIHDPILGPLIAMVIVIIFYYLIVLIGLKGSFGRLRVDERTIKFLAVIIAIFLAFGLSGLAILLFSNPFIALALLIIAIVIYSKLGRRVIYWPYRPY